MAMRLKATKTRHKALKYRKRSGISISKVIQVILLVAIIVHGFGWAQWKRQEELQEYQKPTTKMSELNSYTPKPSAGAASHAAIIKTPVDPSFQNSSVDHETTPVVQSNADGHEKNPISDCLKLRGTRGYWYQDAAFSRKTFYAYGHRSTSWQQQEIQQLKRMPDQQARNEFQKSNIYKGNQYNWKDTGLGSHCPPMEPMSPEPFCKTLNELQVNRILFVGDSLMQAQVDSFFHLLSLGEKKKDHRSYTERELFIKNRRKEKAISNQKPTWLECPVEIYNQTIQVEFARENLGSNLRPATTNSNEERLQYGPEIPYCKENRLDGDYCPWHLRYNQTTSSSTRTILILNQGAHFHSLGSFSATLNHFLVRFHEIAKPKDILIFRSTVPGHKDCFDHEQPSIPVVNMTHDAFLERYGTSQYDWNLFDSYNQYAAKTLAERLPPSVHFHYLNVYNMTVLRPDEHVSEKDCLHYTHPGPIDFWNHLLATNLRDIMSSSLEYIKIPEM